MSIHNLTTGLGRLKQLRDDLIMLDAMQVKPISFRMSTWVRQHPCGTSACAVGYCAMQPWAQKQGLVLEQSRWAEYRGATLWPRYGEHVVFNAVAEFFQVSEDDAFFMFDDGSYERDDDEDYEPTIQDVVARIDEVVARSGAPA